MDKKFSLSSDTDLHFNLLADNSKLKLNTDNSKLENILELNNNENNNENNDINNLSDSNKINNNDNQNNKKYDSDSEKSYNKVYSNEKESESNKSSSNSSNKSTNKSSIKSNSKIKNSVRSNSSSPINLRNEDNKDDKLLNENVNNLPINQININDEIPYERLDEQTKLMKKMELYAEILSIKKTGIKLTKDYSLQSNYNDMLFEVNYWRNYQKKKDAVNIGKNFMINAITALEFLNESYDPFGFKLKGWSEQMDLNKDSYDGVFGELYEKYKKTGKKMEPEIKLILMIGASAASFHASKKMAESLPGLDSVLQNNPNLLSSLQNVINKNIDKDNNKDEISNEDKQNKMYDQMTKIKEQKKKFEEIRKVQKDLNDNSKMMKEQMNYLNKESNNNNNNNNINKLLDKIKEQNIVNKANKVLNDNLSDNLSDSDSEKRVSVSNNNSADAITIGSDGKPKKKRETKKTITIDTSKN